MQAADRRQAILECLQSASLPVSAGALATRFSVSRQVIVGDIALLRAGGAEISATPRGYVIQQSPAGLVQHVACRHSSAEMEAELNIFVDNGCTVLDVIVEHPVYGQITGPLQLSNRYDVQQFIARCTAPLSRLTEGIHLHTVSFPNEDAYRRALAQLDATGFLLKDEENR